MIARELLDRVVAAVGPDADQSELRRRFPGLSVTVCSDEDIPARLQAACETAAARFYYLDVGEHCAGLTQDADSASGIVVGLLGESER